MGETERRSEMFRDRERFTKIAGSPRIFFFHRATLNIQECLTVFNIRSHTVIVIKPFKASFSDLWVPKNVISPFKVFDCFSFLPIFHVWPIRSFPKERPFDFIYL